MIRYEDPLVERAALSTGVYIAIPIEIHQSAAGQPSITTYAACSDIAEKFLSVYGTDPLQKEALKWIAGKVQTFMAAYGYRFDPTVSRVILEYTVDRPILPTPLQNDVICIKTIDEWMQYQNKTDAEPGFDNEESSTAFVVVENKKIISCACTNDVYYANDALEIHVETASEYRNRGFGHACVSALLSYLTRQGHSVWYKCYEDNSASAAIARSCGFRLAGRRVSFVCCADEG